MLVMRASGRFAGSLGGAHSHLSGHGSNRSSACLQGPRPTFALLPAAGSTAPSRPTASGPSSALAAGATSAPARNSSSSSPLRVSTAAVRGGSSSTRLGRPVVQAAAGRGSGGGRAGRGSSASGRGRGSGRDPADDMTVCQTLEELQALISQRLSVWEGRKDFITMFAAFNLCGRLESSGGAAATAVARSSIIGALAPAYLPLVPRIRDAKNCSIPLLALGKAGIVGGGGGTEAQLAAALLERLVDPEVHAEATTQNLANALYALGKLQEQQQQRGWGWDPTSSPHLQTLASAVASRLGAAVGHGFKPQELSNILWACAKLGYADPGLLLPLAEAAATLSVSMKVQELANSLWAMEALGCTGPEYRSAVKALCGEALQRLRIPELAAAFTPQELSNILLALEGLQLGGKQAELVAAVAAEDVRRGFDGYVAQDLSNSAWALAKMGFGVGPEAPVEQRQWVSAAVDAAMRPGVMARATPQAWANLLYALSMMRHQPPAALLDAGASAAMRASSADGQDCTNSLYALAVLQLRHAGLEAAVVGRLGELLQRGGEALTEQGISNSLWAMAAFGNTCFPGMQQLAVQLARNAAGRRWKGFTDEGLRQLWQAQQELGGEVAAALGSSPGLQAAMDKSVETYRQDTKRLSETHKQLLAALRRLEGLATAGGLAVQSVQTGVVAPGVLTPVDVLVGLSDGRQVAVEWVTVVRFLSNRKQDPSAVNGSTVLRHRQLRRAFGEGGVLLVPYWEWDGLQTAEEQEAYLLRRLQQPAVAVETVTAGVVGGAAAVITAAPHQPATTTTTTTKGGGGSGSNPQQQLLVRPARRPEGGGGG